MTKLPDDVVREIEKACGDFHCKDDLLKFTDEAFIEGAEFGFKLSQAKAKKLVIAVDNFLSINMSMSAKAAWYEDLVKALSTFKQETTPREDER